MYVAKACTFFYSRDATIAIQRTNMLIFRFLVVGWLVGLSFVIAPGESVGEQPNIVFIFSDDHALNSISSYEGSLASVAPTPNIDRIAREGALFRN